MDNKDMTIEENFEAIESLISKLEQENLSLEESFSLYNEALSYVKQCNDKIDGVEKQIKIIQAENNSEGEEIDGEF